MRGNSVSVNRALLRPILFCGAEKKATLIYGLLTVIIAVSSNFHAPGIYIAPVVFIVSHCFFLWLAKKDPQMIALYQRHLQFRQGFYPASGGVKTQPDKLKILPTVSTRR